MRTASSLPKVPFNPKDGVLYHLINEIISFKDLLVSEETLFIASPSIFHEDCQPITH
jgi:hypothetical protein